MGLEKLKYDYYTVEDYLEIDNNDEQKFEYYLGEVTAMAGATTTHNTISLNIVLTISPQISNKCRIFMSDVRLEVKENAIYYYPDIILTCNEADINNPKSVSSPSLVVEVLSPSTESKDLNEKLEVYTKIPSVLYYLVVGQKPFSVKLYERANDFWKFTSYTNENDEIFFPQLNIKMTLKEIYKNIVVVENKAAEVSEEKEDNIES